MSGAAEDRGSADATLAAALREAGSPFSVAAVRDILAGLAAAPESGTAGEEDLWLSLVAPAADEGLRKSLRRLRAEAANRTAPIADPAAVPERVERLRAELQRRDLEGFLVPRADEHQGEFVPKRAQRLLWLTGFSGSAGLAVLLRDRGAIFVDGRYTLQVRTQVPVELFAPHHLVESPPARWIAANLPAGSRLGYDPWLHTRAEVARFAGACERAGATLVACETNPLDAVWEGQPPPPLAPVVPQELRFAGRAAADKRRELGEKLEKGGADAVVLTAPDSIAWLLNIRGGDVEHTPLPLCFAILYADGRVRLFVDERKLVPGLLAHLGNGVAVERPDGLGAALDALGEEGRRVVADPASAPVWIFERLGKGRAQILRGQDPCLLPKACKNAVELDGARAAHRRDAAAVARFLAWLAREAPAGRVTELDAEARLLAFRQEIDRFRDASFATISGAGPNGAIVHYRSTSETNRRLEPGMLYLVDSGAQYVDGTTDITRTIAVGEPTAEQRDRFTRVLKGHIALATARFPKGTTGPQLDVLARQHLWQAGLDFDHGTGHGVGSYLSVHEGPQRISKLPNNVALQPGMILSNEPGYYKEGAYGIRIENLLAVRPCAGLAGAERESFEFETLTLAPIDLALVEPALLTPAERDWLNAYHARVRETVGPMLDAEAAAWLSEATREV